MNRASLVKRPHSRAGLRRMLTNRLSRMAPRVFLQVQIILVICYGVLATQPPNNANGFYMVSNLPEMGRHKSIYIYAIRGDGDPGEIEITKEGGLPSNVVKQGELRDASGEETFGCYLEVRKPNRFPITRIGQYTGTFTPTNGAVDTGFTFVKPQSKLLNTRGIYTVTIYPATEGSPDLASPVSIGVALTPGCNELVWCKGRRRDINRGPRYTLRSTEDAGLYTISRPGRAKRGYSVQIRVIAATCPYGYYHQMVSDSCRDISGYCLNGGLKKDRSVGQQECICPPTFVGPRCECAVRYVSPPGERINNQLAFGNTGLFCADLPGGNAHCKGHLICHDDNYGCKCAPGWFGNACDRPCPIGRWGADCDQRCPSSDSACNRYYGPASYDACSILLD